MTHSSRRALLGASVTTALGGIAATAFAKPESLAPGDVELAHIGASADPLLVQRAELSRQWWATPTKANPRDRRTPAELAELERISHAMEPVDDALDGLIERATDLRGAHPNALRAKARLIQHQLRVEWTSDSGTALSQEVELIWSLCEDLTGEAL